MTDLQPESPNPLPAASARPRLLQFVLAALPFVLTGSAAVLISFLLQCTLMAALDRQPLPVATSTPSRALTQATSPPLPTPSTAPPLSSTSPGATGADVRVLNQEIIDLREANRRLWSALYLMRSVVQLGDAEVALQNNDLAEVERLLLTVRVSLDQAYAFSAEQEKGPIDAFRVDLGRIRDDLRLRPEGLDRRLRELRRLVLGLVDEGG